MSEAVVKEAEKVVANAAEEAGVEAPTAKPEENVVPQIQIEQIGTTTMLVPIIGTAPLIVHNFSEKSKRQMLEAQQGKKSVKQHRDPDAEYKAAFYNLVEDDGNGGTVTKYGFPAVAFKAATIGAARFYGKAIKMTEIRQFLFFKGRYTSGDPQQLIEIEGTPEMREDVVRLGGVGRSADLRYRPQFTEWSTTLEVTFVKSSLSQDSVLSLIDAGGLGVGVGEWRPERNGSFGTYQIDPNREVKIING